MKTGLRLRAGVAEQCLLAGTLVAVAAWLAHSDWLWRWDSTLFDAQLRLWSRPAPVDIVMVSIDESSLSELGRWPWSRRLHAALIERLSADGAAVIALDIIFSEPDARDPDGDRLLSDAIRMSRRTVLPVFVAQTRLGGQLVEQLPIPMLSEVAAGLGHVDVELDHDGLARSVYLTAGLTEKRWPALSVAMLRVLDEGGWHGLPGERNPGAARDSPHAWTRDHRVLIPFSGPPGHFARISYVQALRGEFAPGTFADKLVLIGVTATGLGDALPTPVSGESRPMPGVEFNANVLEALRTGMTLQRLEPRWRLALTCLLVLLPMLIYPRLGPRWGLVTALGLVLATLAISAAMLLALHRWFAPAAALLPLLVSYPLWAWRRLESALRYLERELSTLQAEQESVPVPSTPAIADSMTFLAEVLPIAAWTLRDAEGSDQYTSGELSGQPPQDLAPGRWVAQGAVLWARVAEHPAIAYVGLRWTDAQAPSDGQLALLHKLIRREPTASSTRRGDPVEVVQARIQQVQRATARLRSMRHVIDDSLAQMGNGVLVASSHGQVILANHQAARSLGIDAGEKLAGLFLHHLLERLEWQDGGGWRERLGRVIGEGESVQLNARSVSGDDLLIQMSPLAGGGDVPHGLIMNLSDISELKESERRRAEVLGFLSHDLRSPLVSVLALIALAEAKQTPEELRALLRRAEGYTQKTLSLAEQFLELARAESTEPHQWREVDVVSVAINAFEHVWAQAQSKRIDLQRCIEVEELWTFGDADLLERALINLLTNAIKYSPEESSVRLSLSRTGGEIFCCIHDRGHGIAEQDLPKLFARFERIRAVHSAGEHGVGLGLVFVKTVAERHGGRIDVKSTSSVGSTFCLVLPFAPDGVSAQGR